MVTSSVDRVLALTGVDITVEPYTRIASSVSSSKASCIEKRFSLLVALMLIPPLAAPPFVCGALRAIFLRCYYVDGGGAGGNDGRAINMYPVQCCNSTHPRTFTLITKLSYNAIIRLYSMMKQLGAYICMAAFVQYFCCKVDGRLKSPLRLGLVVFFLLL